MSFVLVIGAGPAGLMAAETLATQGVPVVVAEAKPSVGRKLLMAGKSGLNLTKEEPWEPFLAAYGPAAEFLQPMLKGFGPNEVCQWAKGLGQPVFTGSSGLVFPKTMKASPLLRAWLLRLTQAGVDIKTRWHWQGWQGQDLVFDTPEGRQNLRPVATVLALGGASWARLGSDGLWWDHLQSKGIKLRQLQPANMGFDVRWSPHMTRFFGQPVKNVGLRVEAKGRTGEFLISRHGVEGSGIYFLSKTLRQGGRLFLDLLPDLDQATLRERIMKMPRKSSMANVLRKAAKLAPVKAALLREFSGKLETGDVLAAQIKNLEIPLQRPRPIDEAISTAGGVALHAVAFDLELSGQPGLFCAGEMLDWEAPTGGYLLTACLATGQVAGQGAARYYQKSLAL